MDRPQKLDEKFTKALLKTLTDAGLLTGISEARLKKEAEERGGAEALSRLISRGSTTAQFDALAKQGRLDLSAEALVIRGEYAPLFTDEVVNTCLSTLLSEGYFG